MITLCLLSDDLIIVTSLDIRMVMYFENSVWWLKCIICVLSLKEYYYTIL